MSETF
jgi:hypothetical protein